MTWLRKFTCAFCASRNLTWWPILRHLYRVAINVAQEWRQRAIQSLDHSSEPLSDLAAATDMEQDTVDNERILAVRQALAHLTNASRSAVILHTRDGLTYDEIARHMNVTRRAVKRYIANGYAELRERLATLTPVGPAGRANEYLSASPPEERQ